MSRAGEDAELRLIRRASRLLFQLRAGGRLERVDSEAEAPRYEVRVAGERAPRLIAQAGLIDEMARRDWLARGPDGGWTLSPAGRALLARSERPEEAFRAQHLALSSPDSRGDAPDAAAVVDNESPLAWLRRRRDRTGRPMISQAQYLAGERLRAEFTRAHMTPRVTSDWNAMPTRRRRGGNRSESASMTETALAARQRLERVLAALGPELGGLLLDVCCYLGGMEDAERRRGWPRRSAKVVLQIALDRLAVHYGLADEARGADAAGLRHWGAEGYKPR